MARYKELFSSTWMYRRDNCCSPAMIFPTGGVTCISATPCCPCCINITWCRSINENDSVSVRGVQIGENDRLAALIAGKVQCDVLIILSDVEGLFTADPTRHPEATIAARSARDHPGD